MGIQITRKAWLIAASAAVLLLAAACSSSMSDDDAANSEAQPPMTNADSIAEGGMDGDSASNRSAGEQAGAPQLGTTGASDAPDAATGSTDSNGAPLPALLDRKMIMTATLTLETDEVSKRFEDVGNIAAGAGGFVASSSFGNSGEQQTASITIRIPSDGYQRAIVELRKLGTVTAEQSGANDVTEEYTDLESRLRGLRAVEQQYMEFLTRAVSIDEVLTVQDRLNGVRVEMEQIQGRINLLSNQTDLATITVHLEPPVIVVEPPSEGGSVTPLEALENGWEASLAVLGGVAVVTLAVLAFSWWLIRVFIVGAFVVRRFVKSNGTRSLPPATVEPSA
jgi:hypothetical protein